MNDMVFVREHYRGKPQSKATAKATPVEPDLFISVEELKRSFPEGRIIKPFGVFGDQTWFFAQCKPDGPLVFALEPVKHEALRAFEG